MATPCIAWGSSWLSSRKAVKPVMGDWVYQVFMSLPSVGQTETSHIECFAASSTHLQNCLFDPGYVTDLARGKKETRGGGGRLRGEERKMGARGKDIR